MARIIYVEDDDLVAELVQRALAEAGHVVGVIDHGVLGHDAILFKHPDLILLDCSLPGMKGVDILKRVRAIPDIYLTPIVMLSAIADPAVINQAIEAGANDYIVKPVDLVALVERIDAVLALCFYRSKVSARISTMATIAAEAPVPAGASAAA